MSENDLKVVAWKCEIWNEITEEWSERVYQFNPKGMKSKVTEKKIVRNVEPLVKLNDLEVEEE